MSIYTKPKVRIDPEGGDSVPVEATLMTDGRIRLQTDPDSGSMNGSWLTVAEIREFATDLLALCDASETIYG